MGAWHGEERKRTSIWARRRLASSETGTRRAAIEFDEFLEFFALALNYLSRPRALGAANTSKLSYGARRALGSSDKPKGSSVSADARTFRCETHRALAEARRARARAGVHADGGADRRHTGREPESSRDCATSLCSALFFAVTS